MTLVPQAVQDAGLEFQEEVPGEFRAACAEADLPRLATLLAGEALLADLFASVDGDDAWLTAVFAPPREPSWLVLRTRLAGPSFASLTPWVHAASWYEREIKEMYGLEPLGHPAPVHLRLHDWPDHVFPMRDDVPRDLPGAGTPEQVPTVRGQGVLQVPLGPVRSGAQESAEFLFSSGGEDLVMVAPRLGYKFRAVERLAEGRPVDVALTLAERLAGVSTLSNALAFVQATERAIGLDVPPRARHARSVLGELERLHHHFGTIARVAEACGQTVAAAQYAMLKEEALRAGAALTGHRYLRGVLAVGGLAFPLRDTGLADLADQAPRWSRRASSLAHLLEDTATFVDRLEGTAVLPEDYAALHNLLGPIGRASGANRDSRRDRPYAAYGGLSFQVPVEHGGDARARVAVVQAEIAQSLALLGALLGEAPGGEFAAEAAVRFGSALGWAEAPGGEALHYVELDERGLVRRWRARPPACVNWHPFAFACASGNNLTDYPVLEASFSLSHAEFDR